MDKLIETFCDVDDFCQLFIEQWCRQLVKNGTIKHRHACRLTPAEIMTTIIHFHQSHYRDFKNYYLNYLGWHRYMDATEELNENSKLSLQEQLKGT